jgi:hypothetical protein
LIDIVTSRNVKLESGCSRLGTSEQRIYTGHNGQAATGLDQDRGAATTTASNA